MALFSTLDVNIKVTNDLVEIGSSKEFPEKESFSFFSKLKNLKPELENLQINQVLHFCSDGRFSAHELLLYLLQLHPGNDVYIATWKVSEDPARLLVKAKEKGWINNLYLLVERRMQINSPSALQLIERNSTHFAMTDIHAKVFVIDNPVMPVTVVTSANMSDNRRIEVGVVDTHAEAALFHKNWIKEKIELCRKKN